MIIGYSVQEGTVEHSSSLAVPSFEAAFDEVTQRYPQASYLMLEEWGPGDDMVPILSRFELRNARPDGKRYLSALPTHRRAV